MNKKTLSILAAVVGIISAILFLYLDFPDENGGDVSSAVSESEISSTVSQTVSESENSRTVSQTVSESENSRTVSSESPVSSAASEPSKPKAAYRFRNQNLLNQHYEKHGKDMGFISAAQYEKAASDVITNSAALHKTEAEDGDDIYYIAETNEFVVLSTDGYIRTYFLPDAGRAYYEKQ